MRQKSKLRNVTKLMDGFPRQPSDVGFVLICWRVGGWDHWDVTQVPLGITQVVMTTTIAYG